MEVVELGKEYDKPMVLCLGFFDCMHLGHMKLLSCAQTLAGRTAKVVIFTFSNNHFEMLGRPTKLLFTFEERLKIYESVGVDAALCANFDEKFMDMSGKEFLRKICMYNLRGVVFGRDYTCGCDLLTAESAKSFLTTFAPVKIVETVMSEGRKVGSTLIRDLLSQHKVEQANSLLSRPFFFSGVVVRGRREGHALGFPTANIEVSSQKLAPEGVYAGFVRTGCCRYKAIVNVGAAPTFDFRKLIVEAHLLNFDGDLYGHEIEVSLVKYLRPITKFETESQLRAQLNKDREVADDQIRT